MLSQFQANYQRMDHSLQRLTDSIAAYNPSPAAAEELVAADDAVNESLDQLIEHQRNHHRIEELKQLTESLDEALKNTLRQLVERRKELLDISSTDDALLGPETTVDEILSYARFISPTTVPPTFRQQDVPLQPGKDDREHADTHMTNGITTPPPGGAQEAENVAQARAEVLGQKVVNDEEDQQAWLNPHRRLPFEPWPSQEVIQRGALADIQRMMESGTDPASVLSAEEQAAADRKRWEDEERAKQEEQERERRRMSMFDTTGRRRDTVDQSDVFDPDA